MTWHADVTFKTVGDAFCAVFRRSIDAIYVRASAGTKQEFDLVPPPGSKDKAVIITGDSRTTLRRDADGHWRGEVVVGGDDAKFGVG